MRKALRKYGFQILLNVIMVPLVMFAATKIQHAYIVNSQIEATTIGAVTPSTGVFSALTDSALTSGKCVQAGAGGVLGTTSLPCTNTPYHVVSTTGVFTTCVMVGHSSTDISCSGTQAWLTPITGTYYAMCSNYTAGVDWSSTADTNGITRFVLGTTSLTSTNLSYYESSLQGGAAGATTQAYCIAVQ